MDMLLSFIPLFISLMTGGFILLIIMAMLQMAVIVNAIYRTS